MASLSPILTLGKLWQVKEWRWDRLLEHLRREGWLIQLFGLARPAVVVAFNVLFLLRILPFTLWMFAFLLALDALCLAQFSLRKQKKPVWTQKALMIVSTSIVLTFLLALACAWPVTPLAPVFLPLLVLLQPFVLALAWLLWRPVDYILKERIVRRAKQLRGQHPDLTVIGITGSVGKTTTKELVACVLADLHPHVTPAFVNSEIGVARWMIQMLSSPEFRHSPIVLRNSPHLSQTDQKPGGKVFVVEMGAYRKGEIAYMSEYIRQTIGVVTFVGTQHLALFGSQENLQQAKSEILTHLLPEGHAFLNGDSPLCKELKDVCPCPVTIVGTGGVEDLEAFDIEETPTGIRFRALDTAFDVPIHGTHNVTNVLLAIAVAQHMGIGLLTMRERLRTFTPPSHTFNVRKEGSVLVLDDTHNSSAASFKAGIAWARSQPYPRKILLTSGLIELGEAQEESEKELGILASKVFDTVIFLTDKSIRAFQEGFGRPVHIYGKDMPAIPPDSLLACIGRMSESTWKRLLP